MLRVILAALSIAAVTNPAPSAAQSYPDRLVRIIVPQSPGGPTDLLARATAQRLQAAYGQNVIAENRGGAGGAIAAKMVASTEPDGYTLLLGNTSVLIHVPLLFRGAGYDPAKAFAPVARLSTSYQVIFVHPSVPVKSIHELIAYAKANPGKLPRRRTVEGTSRHRHGPRSI
jgi:tripartite-type tricarboxylate transporter receptor subunit TctC